MGLDTSHDAFHGPYSKFNRFRQMVAKAIGGSFPPHFDADHSLSKTLNQENWYWVVDDQTELTGLDLAHYQRTMAEKRPGLYLFFMHSDCDGEFKYYEAKTVADGLREILPSLKPFNTEHDDYVEMCQTFIDGCMRAYEAREPLDFH